MKTLSSILATLALSSVLAVAQEAKPAEAPAGTKATEVKPVEAKPVAPAPAEKPKHDPAEAFKRMDTNSDGSVSAEEFKASPKHQKNPARAEDMFKKMDKNSDGKLTLDEVTVAKHAAK